jgi:outer membrane protein assembly factor BamB
MHFSRILFVAIFSTIFCACKGGGGSTVSPTAAWEKFRHDFSNSGQGGGLVANPTPGTTLQVWSVLIDPTPPATPAPVSSSPAIALDGTVYVGSEGGTLAAVTRNADGSLGFRWRETACLCASSPSPPLPCPPHGDQELGPLVSSPAVSTLNGQTIIFIGSRNGAVFVFLDNGGTQPSSCGYFRPELPIGATAEFLSSPSFTEDAQLSTVPGAFSTINGVFVGARIFETTSSVTPTPVGKFYALNSNASEKWEYPRPGDPDIAPITSSPALGLGGTWYFTTDDGNLYALTGDGTLKWTQPIDAMSNLTPNLPFATSPLITTSSIFVATQDGIFRVTQDGHPLGSMASGESFAASLATGLGAATTPTPTPATATTPTPPALAFLYGVTSSGVVVGLDPAVPTPTVLPTPQTPISTPVLSSPALSAEGLLVFGTTDGRLHAVNTVTGAEPDGWPVTLAPGSAIRSSPSIAADGTVYVGADDGKLYAVGFR